MGRVGTFRRDGRSRRGGFKSGGLFRRAESMAMVANNARDSAGAGRKERSIRLDMWTVISGAVPALKINQFEEAGENPPGTGTAIRLEMEDISGASPMQAGPLWI